jgi:hypothetical protein
MACRWGARRYGWTRRPASPGGPPRVPRDRHIERTEEWFAQDRAGNVWYFGEDMTSYENGMTSTKGSFEAAWTEPGVQMSAKPKAGMRYRLEGATSPELPTTPRC